MLRWILLFISFGLWACAQPTSNTLVNYTVQVVNTYPHDPNAFTQGLVYHDGFFYEGTGLNGRSELRKVELTTGKVLQRKPLQTVYFGEGIVLLGDRIFQITWKNKTAFVWNATTFEAIRTFSYETEGWGLTTDGKSLIMSDGTANLYFRSPTTFQVERQVRVTLQGQPVTNLNELEYIDGKVYANIWQTDQIVIINPQSGVVEGVIDLSNLAALILSGDVLNGIAYDAQGKRLFVTGKLWPYLFEVRLVRR